MFRYENKRSSGDSAILPVQMGIHLVKTLTDEMRYRRVGEHNHLRLVKLLETT